MNGPEVFPINVRIDLRCREVRVPQHLLESPEVGTAFEEVRGEGVTERVGRDAFLNARSTRTSFDHIPRTDARQWTAAGIQKEHAFGFAAVEARSDFTCIKRRGADGPATHGTEALLVALPEHSDQAVVQPEVGGAESHEFRHPDSRSVSHLEERPVSPGERFLRLRSTEQGFDLL
jgi:hypothetical protein